MKILEAWEQYNKLNKTLLSEFVNKNTETPKKVMSQDIASIVVANNGYIPSCINFENKSNDAADFLHKRNKIERYVYAAICDCLVNKYHE